MRPHQDQNVLQQIPVNVESGRLHSEQTVPLVKSARLTSSVAADAGPSHDVGSIIGNRYLLQNHVGMGRLGEIYEAVDQQLTQAGQRDYRVVIELFTSHNNQSQESTQFASEFVDLLSFSHPNLARIIDYGVDGATSFIITELLEGASLRAILDSASNDACTRNEVLAVVGGVAEALTYAHSKGFVHGDLSPESIFITSNFDVKVADFAGVVLARSLGSFAEKQEGSSQSRKSSADVFGLAAIAYELLSNEPPYNRASRHEARVRGIELAKIKGVPRAQWKALAGALALRPKKRTPSIASFTSEFGIDGKVSMTAAPERKQFFYRWLRWPVFAVAAVAATYAVLGTQEKTPAEIWSDFRGAVDTQLATISSTKNETLELLASEQADASIELPAESSEAVERLVEDAASTTLPGSVLVSNVPEAGGQEEREAAGAEPVAVEELAAAQAQQSTAPDAAAVTTNVAVNMDSAQQSENQKTAPAPVSEAAYTAAETVAATAVEAGSNLAGATAISPQPTTADEEAQAAAAASTHASTGEQMRISFEQDVIIAYEGQHMAPISIQRSGPIDAETSILWWTANNTAVADNDYAELGVRTETFKAGEDSLMVFVPLVSDNVRENRESFYAFVGSDLATMKTIDRLEVVVIDNDR